MAKITNTITYSSKLNKIMTDLALKEDISKAEVIRRALVLYSYLYKETSDNGKRIVITNSTGKKAKELVFS